MVMETDELRKLIKSLSKKEKDIITEKANLSPNYLATFSCGQIKEPKRERWNKILSALTYIGK